MYCQPHISQHDYSPPGRAHLPPPAARDETRMRRRRDWLPHLAEYKTSRAAVGAVRNDGVDVDAAILIWVSGEGITSSMGCETVCISTR